MWEKLKEKLKMAFTPFFLLFYAFIFLFWHFKDMIFEFLHTIFGQLVVLFMNFYFVENNFSTKMAKYKYLLFLKNKTI